MPYSFVTGLWKTIKNGLVVLVPAFIAGYAAFLAALPPEYVPVAQVIGGFIGYFFKNLFSYEE